MGNLVMLLSRKELQQSNLEKIAIMKVYASVENPKLDQLPNRKMRLKMKCTFRKVSQCSGGHCVQLRPL